MKNFLRLMLILIIIFISYRVIFYDVLLIDSKISEFIKFIRCEELDYFMMFITKFSDTTSIIILLSIVLFVLIKVVKNKKLAIIFFGGLVCNVFINQSLKVLISRQRPVNSLIYVGGFSFPSGHAMTSMFFYGMLICIFYRLISNSVIKKILILVSSVLILLIGFSRIYLGVHYLSDVIVGFSISLLFLDLVNIIFERYKVFT